MASSPVMPMPRNLRTRTVTAPHMSTVPKRTRRTADAMLLDDSDDEDPPPKARKPAPKAQGPTIRDQVDVLKASLAREEAGYKKKRKGNAYVCLFTRSLSKKPRQGVKTGLRDIPVDDEEDVEAPEPGLLAKLLSISETKHKENPEESEDEEPRGISDGEGDPIEKVGVAKNEKSVVLRCRHRLIQMPSLSPIGPIHRQTPKPKAQLGDDDLPSEVNKRFDEYFGPRVYEYFGTIRPWASVKVDSDTEIIRLWTKYFPNQPSLDSEEPEDVELIRAVQNKVEGRLSNYRNKMTTVASDYLIKTLLPSLNSKGERAEWVEDAIGEPNVWNSKPFYYKTIDMVISEDGEEKPEYKGIFQSPFVAKVFAVHYQFIKDISFVRRSKVKPTGALVLAVQACLHNLTLCKTGERVTQPGKLSQFSANNCDDRQHVSEDNKLVEILATTRILKTVKRLTEKQWLKIIRAAVDMLPRSTAVMRSAVDAAAPSSDIEMIDADDSDD